MPTIRTGRAGGSRWMPRPPAWRPSCQRFRSRAESLTVRPRQQRQHETSARTWLWMTASRPCAWKNRSFNNRYAVRWTLAHAAWPGASHGAKKVMRAIMVPRSQDSCFHASTGKAQACCSLEQEWFSDLALAFENGVQGKRELSSIGLAWLAFVLRINFENTGTLLPLLLLIVFFFTSSVSVALGRLAQR